MLDNNICIFPKPVKEAFKGVSNRFPQVRMWNICIMPDHLHVILQMMALCLMTLDFSPGGRDTLAKMRLSNTGTGIPHRE